MNITRLIAIGGLTFCTTLLSTGFDTTSAFVNAVLITGIAVFTEMKTESEPIIKVQDTLKVGLIL